MQLQTESDNKPDKVLCPYCKEITSSVGTVLCTACGTRHHKACWNENDRCAVYGCSGTHHKTILRRPDWRIDLLFGFIFSLFGFLEAFAWVKELHNPQVAIITGTFIYFWAFLFLASYFWRDASWLLRGIMWVCENHTRPHGAWTAFLWSAVNFFAGTICIIKGFNSN